jgi:hypothetical protein
MSRPKKTASKRLSASARLRSLARALRPAAIPLREMADARLLSIEPLRRAFRELSLDPGNQADWNVLATLLAVHLFDEGKKRGRAPKAPWTAVQLIWLLWEVHKRKQKNSRVSDALACQRIASDKNSPAHAQGKGPGLEKRLRTARRQFQNISEAFPLAFQTKLET